MRALAIPFAVFLAAAAGSAPAQRMGSANTNAPTASSGIAFADGNAIELSYTSITWAEGRSMKMARDPEGGARMRRFINNRAASNPLGKATVKGTVTLGGKAVAAGDYSLYFTIDDDLKWHMVLASKDDAQTKHDWTLALDKGDEHQSRLCLALTAGKSDEAAELEVSFGKMACTVAVESGGKAASRPSKTGGDGN